MFHCPHLSRYPTCLTRRYFETFLCALIPLLIHIFPSQPVLDTPTNTSSSAPLFSKKASCSKTIRSPTHISTILLQSIFLIPILRGSSFCSTSAGDMDLPLSPERGNCTGNLSIPKASSILSSKCFPCQSAGVTGDGACFAPSAAAGRKEG